MARVAVENSLGSIKQVLQENGHNVVSMEEFANADCCVISGQDQNMMGMAGAETKGAVINAEGMTAEEVLDQVNQRAQQI